MKRFRMMLALILTAALLASVATISTAETRAEEEWQADLRKLMDESYAPKVTTIQYDVAMDEGAKVETHDFGFVRVNGDGAALRLDFTYVTAGAVSEEDWAQLDAWLEETADAAIQNVDVDTESLARAVDKALRDARKKARKGEEPLPVWAREDMLLSKLSATMPYYPELSVGVNGELTRRLQERLILLGYLDGEADGYYGEKTKEAVTQLENYVRELEQDLIDARPQPEPTPTAGPDATPRITTEVGDEHNSPEEPPEPTLEPMTPADGVADPMLQAYLYSPDFVPARGILKQGDSGDAVVRLQRRLIRLGYLNGTADGNYGGNTARAVRIFQYINGVELTGTADQATQGVLFSENAKAPEHPILSQGSGGDEVRALQSRLRVLGFMNGSADGDYGAATVSGVKALQQYMRDREEASIRQDVETMNRLEETGTDIATLLTVEVNGVADPLLLDDFYSDDFPAIPADMKSGSEGIDVIRLQRRLSGLEYYYGTRDGSYGNGTESAVRDFQKRNGLTQSGVAGQDTLSLLFSEDAKKALKPYVLKVSTKDQRVYAYGLDDNGEHTKLVRTMKCSTGKDNTPTPKGTFQASTGPGARWHYFKKFTCWAQYAYYIEGDILFHSVLYNEKNGPVTQSSVNNLGRKASHGCVRLSVEDAKWVYKNCPPNTKVVVY